MRLLHIQRPRPPPLLPLLLLPGLLLIVAVAAVLLLVIIIMPPCSSPAAPTASSTTPTSSSTATASCRSAGSASALASQPPSSAQGGQNHGCDVAAAGRAVRPKMANTAEPVPAVAYVEPSTGRSEPAAVAAEEEGAARIRRVHVNRRGPAGETRAGQADARLSRLLRHEHVRREAVAAGSAMGVGQRSAGSWSAPAAHEMSLQRREAAAATRWRRASHTPPLGPQRWLHGSRCRYDAVGHFQSPHPRRLRRASPQHLSPT